MAAAELPAVDDQPETPVARNDAPETNEAQAGDPAAVAPLPQRRPEQTPEEPLKPVETAVPMHPGDEEVEEWTEKEVAEAASACVELLRDLPLEYEHLTPIREGQCGAPAPVSVTAVGANPSVRIAPAAIMTCPLAAALARWVETSMQPAARAHLGAPVIRLRNASAYVCRNRYGLANAPISEHARANALDISLFETATGDFVSVLDHWHAREAPPPPLPDRAPEKPPPTLVSLADSGDADAAEGTTKSPAATGDSQPAARPVGKLDPRALFLRRVHGEACGPFGTVLGPESNAAHADHFHFDGAARRHGAYCQ